MLALAQILLQCCLLLREARNWNSRPVCEVASAHAAGTFSLLCDWPRTRLEAWYSSSTRLGSSVSSCPVFFRPESRLAHASASVRLNRAVRTGHQLSYLLAGTSVVQAQRITKNTHKIDKTSSKHSAILGHHYCTYSLDGGVSDASYSYKYEIRIIPCCTGGV